MWIYRRRVARAQRLSALYQPPLTPGAHSGPVIQQALSAFRPGLMGGRPPLTWRPSPLSAEAVARALRLRGEKSIDAWTWNWTSTWARTSGPLMRPVAARRPRILERRAPNVTEHRLIIPEPAAFRLESLPPVFEARYGLLAFRSMFGPRLFRDFLHSRSRERRFFDLVIQKDLALAEEERKALEATASTDLEAALCRKLEDALHGGGHEQVPWGEIHVVDFMRLRHLRGLDPSGSSAKSLRNIGLLGVLSWLGRRSLEIADAAQVPEWARKTIAVATASAAGYRKAVGLLPLWFKETSVDHSSRFKWVSLLCLRAVFEGAVTPRIVSWLIPPPASRGRRPRGEATWLPLGMALRWAVENKHEAGMVFVLSALMSTAFRRSISDGAESLGRELSLGPWGAGALDEEQRGDLTALCRDLSAWDFEPWRHPLCRDVARFLSIDMEAVDAVLDSVLGGVSPNERWHLYSDEGLLHALLFTILGNTVSARLHLGEASTEKGRGWVELAERSNLERAREKLLTVLRDALHEKRLNELYMALAETPDPNVALGTPYWTVARGVRSLASVLMRTGRREALSQVRLLQQRPEIRKLVEPYWLLRANDKWDLIRTLQRLPLPLEQVHPSQREWTAYLELLSRQVLEERKWTP